VQKKFICAKEFTHAWKLLQPWIFCCHGFTNYRSEVVGACLTFTKNS